MKVSEANELRRGNWLLMDGKYEMVHTIADNELNYYRYDEIEPIPITEEILLKCEQLNIPNNNETYHFKKDGLEYYWVKDSGLKVYSGLVGLTSYPCEHLHEFQNLYRDIMGEELNIEL